MGVVWRPFQNLVGGDKRFLDVYNTKPLGLMLEKSYRD